MDQRPLCILLDLDSVCNDLLTVWYERYNRDYNDDMCVERQLTWDMHAYVKPECGKAIYRYLSEPGLYRNLPVMDGAVEGIQALKDMGCKVFIVSACSPSSAGEKMLWVKDYLPPVNGFISVYSYGKDAKALIAGDILIDDGPHNIEHSIATHKIVVDFGYPYNRDVHADYRAHSWPEIVAAVQEIAEQRFTEASASVQA